MIRKMMRNLLGESYTESNGKLAIVNFGIILIMFIVSGIMLLPSALAVWLLPLIALLINIGFIKQNRLSKVNTAVFVILLIAMTATYISNL